MSGEGDLKMGNGKILVVDDSLMSRKLVVLRLTKGGHDVVTANSGKEALEIIQSEPVNLIFLDLVMEEMDGLEVLRWLKSNELYKAIPVVMISGVEDIDAVNDCLDAGANDFLHKPVIGSALQEIVADLLGGGSQQDSEQGNTTVEEPEIDDLALLDAAYVTQMLSDYGTETAGKFITRFEELSVEQKNGILAAAATNNLESWSRLANGLKGGARTLGLMRLAASCREIERACSQDRLEDAKSATGLLGEKLTQSLDALRVHMASV